MTTLELRSVSLTSGTAARVREVTARVHQSGLTAIVGANGSGKSSLLSLLAGQVAPTAGQVLLGDKPLTALSPHERSRNVAWLGQSTPGAESFAVLDVISWGAASWGKDSSSLGPTPREACEQFGLTHLEGAPLGSLSGGERQRAHLARVWVQAAPITLLDEPDASLDEPGRLLLRAAIEDRVQRGHSVVIVTHDRAWANNAADHLWVMDSGQLASQ